MNIPLIFLRLITFSLLVVAELDLDSSQAEIEFDNFKKLHGKKYKDTEEESQRKRNFIQNFNVIKNCNKEQETSTCGINANSDMSPEELNGLNGVRLPRSFNIDPSDRASLNITLPNRVDYRNDPCMPAIKNQGQCASCWAFTANTPLEFRVCRAKANTSVVLSEQNLVDCAISANNKGCNYGFYTYAWDYVKENGGQNLMSTYPYIGKQGACNYNPNNVAAKVKGYRYYNTISGIQSVLATSGPVAAVLDANLPSFQSYRGGIYSDPSCSTKVNHAVTIVGYDTVNGIDVWIIRNSWGPSWGINGYMFLQRGVNRCGVESFVFSVTPLL